MIKWFSRPVNKSKGVDSKLVFFGLYLCFLVYLIFTTHSWKTVLSVHIVAVFLFSIYYFGREFFFIATTPLMAVSIPINNFLVRRFLKKFKQDSPSEVVVILAHSDFRELEAWVKPNFFITELLHLTAYLKKKGQDFSFYANASIEDVKSIMTNKTIREVYFYGHGSSHVFQLGTDDILYYCDFNEKEHGKDFVHQMHCGTPDGKSLVDYVVPEGNRNGCFLIRKSITALDIERELKKRTADISLNMRQ